MPPCRQPLALWSLLVVCNAADSTHISRRLAPHGLEVRSFAEGRGLCTLRDRTAGEVLLSVDDADVVNFLLQTEIIPLCLRIMETGSELSKTVATFIVQKVQKLL